MEPQLIAISKFKATCLELLKKVKATGQPLLITRNNEPVAMVVPPPTPDNKPGWLGCMQSSGVIKGDIVSPAVAADDWEVLEP